MFSRLTVIAAAAAAGTFGLIGNSGVEAAPFAQVSVLARESGSGDAFSDSIQVEVGETYDYQVRVKFAPVGTTNTQGSTVRTITQLSSGVDGVNNFAFNLQQAADSQNQVNFAVLGTVATPSTSPAAGIDWTAGSSDTPGVRTARGVTGNFDIIGARPFSGTTGYSGLQATGDVAYFGTFNIASVGDTASLLNVSFGNQGSTLKYNNGTTFIVSSAFQNGADPVFSYSGLSVAAVPEPASLAVIGLASTALLRRRRNG